MLPIAAEMAAAVDTPVAAQPVAYRTSKDKPDFTPKERCWPIGVPGWMLYPVRPVWFLQTPKEVTMIWEEDHMVRHVYLNAQHSPDVWTCPPYSR